MNRLLERVDFYRWSASVLPALIGTVLPFWLYHNRFSFNLAGAIEFIIAAVLFHAGFSLFLKTVSKDGHNSNNLLIGIGLLVLACLIGLHINTMIPNKAHVPDFLFLAFGISAIVTGLLFVIPPISLHSRPGREILLAEGFGFLPVLGAFIVQVGDLHRTVYLAAFPVIALTWLWVWVLELDSYKFGDKESSNKTLVHLVGISLSTRLITPILYIAPAIMILGAVLTKSLPPLSLLAILMSWPAMKLAYTYYKGEIDPTISMECIRQTAIHHGTTCLILIISIGISQSL